MLEIILNILIMILMPFIAIGFINKIKAIWAGRKGPSLFQSFYDFIKLLKKGEIISPTTSFIFKTAPSISLACTIIAGLLVPMINHKSIINFDGNFILFAYILALGRFLSILSALDTGSSFEGMGASREVTFSMFVEPAFFIIIASFSLLTGKTSFDNILSFFNYKNLTHTLIIILTVITFFIMILTETCRVPIDDPNTHLELTMIHEVMILDNSGVDLGFILYTNSLKLIILSSLISSLIIPAGITIGLSILLYIMVILFIALIIGVIESVIPRLRMSHVPQFIFLMTSTSLIILSIIVLIINGGIN